VVAVGELGLDYYRMHSPRDAQLTGLQAQLALATRHAMPVVVHCRDAWDEMRAVLTVWARDAVPAFAGRPVGVMHYFTGTLEDAQHYIELGFLISVHTSVTHPKSQPLRDVVALLPLGALVIETDSPYGAPQSHRGKRNQPAYVVEAARQIATLKGVTVEEVAETTSANAIRLFRLHSDETRLARLPDSPIAQASR
jgi:TatD DNase family protein